MTTKAVQNLLNDVSLLGGDQHSIVELVRELVKTIVPTAVEEVKYGGILYIVEEHFCGVFAYKKHVSVEFSYGAKIADPLGLLEGNGKGRRHIKLYTVDDIETTNLAHYIPLALEAARKDA